MNSWKRPTTNFFDSPIDSMLLHKHPEDSVNESRVVLSTTINRPWSLYSSNEDENCRRRSLRPKDRSTKSTCENKGSINETRTFSLRCVICNIKYLLRARVCVCVCVYAYVYTVLLIYENKNRINISNKKKIHIYIFPKKY